MLTFVGQGSLKNTGSVARVIVFTGAGTFVTYLFVLQRSARIRPMKLCFVLASNLAGRDHCQNHFFHPKLFLMVCGRSMTPCSRLGDCCISLSSHLLLFFRYPVEVVVNKSFDLSNVVSVLFEAAV